MSARCACPAAQACMHACRACRARWAAAARLDQSLARVRCRNWAAAHVTLRPRPHGAQAPGGSAAAAPRAAASAPGPGPGATSPQPRSMPPACRSRAVGKRAPASVVPMPLTACGPCAAHPSRPRPPAHSRGRGAPHLGGARGGGGGRAPLLRDPGRGGDAGGNGGGQGRGVCGRGVCCVCGGGLSLPASRPRAHGPRRAASPHPSPLPCLLQAQAKVEQLERELADLRRQG